MCYLVSQVVWPSWMASVSVQYSRAGPWALALAYPFLKRLAGTRVQVSQAASNLVGVDRFEEDGHEGVGVGVAAVLELVLDDRWTERGLGWGYWVYWVHSGPVRVVMVT